TYSAHWIAHAGLRDAIAHYLDRERHAVKDEIEYLNKRTPFRKDTQ
ncbi:MAG: peptidogalycan biosysnthesis protein, partial [Pseudomonadota bacterium]